MNRRNQNRNITRREWLAAAGGALLSTTAACRIISGPHDVGSAHLTVTPASPSTPIGPGTYKLNLGAKRDGALYVPPSYKAGVAMPLVVMLHGASGGVYTIGDLPDAAAEAGVLLLAPESRASSWDIIDGQFGPDIDFISRALAFTFERVSVDTRRVGVFGFSDGATYAISLGTANGDLFTHAAAFAPGAMFIHGAIGDPKIFVGHGVDDDHFPVWLSRNSIVPALRARRYDVSYHEVPGGHGITPVERELAFQWFLG
jgi:phospholipase/carboxylesterase